ncbi:MAG: hypothetical protein ABWY33_07635, partial [Cellulomonas sp.]
FLRQTPIFEQMLIDDGILLRKYWFSVSDREQLRRFRSRMNDPVRQWKLSPMDLESVTRWEDYSRARDEMMVHTDVPTSPWYVVESDVKKHARLNMIAHLPAAGEIVLFDRSWYNRAGVEHVMGFCTPQEYSRFMRQTPIFEQMLIEDGILLRKYWFSVSDTEQLKRFRSRLNDPVRQWKLSPMDTASLSRWEEYSKAKDEMLVHTDVPANPWFVVESDIKKHARLNMISHLLSTIPYTDVPHEKVTLPERPAASNGYVRPPRELSTYVPDHVAALMGDPEKDF